MTSLWIESFPADAARRDDAYSRVAWHEGLQLLPQHFQTLDDRVEELLRRQLMAAQPLAWGVDRIDLDLAALAAGRLRVLSGAGQLPDGLVFSFSWKTNGVQDYELDKAGHEGVERYALAVPVDDFREGGAHVSRYREVIGAPVADRGNPDEKAAIARWQPSVTIRPWDPSSRNYIQLPFAEVVKTATGYELTGYHPPMTRLMADSLVAADIARMLHLVRGKIDTLQVGELPGLLGKHHRNGLRPVLGALTAGLPRLEALLAARVAHPYAIFLSLCDMAGSVAELTGRAPDLFTPYDHFDLAAALRQATQYICRVVESIGVDHRRWREVPCVLRDGRWICTVPEDSQQPLLFRVVFNPSQTDAAMSFWVERTLVCWATEEDKNRELRTKGMSRRQSVALPEYGLPLAPAQRYLQVDAKSPIAAGRRELVIGVPDERSLNAVNEIRLLMYAQ